MKLSVISFTENGKQLSERIAQIFKGELEICLYTKCAACMDSAAQGAVQPVKASVAEWAGERMRERDAMLFIGACGIAVRAVAPFLTGKLQDAPVLVMDERGRYVIPVLAGHMGGANGLAVLLAGKTGAEPVITTATDINQKFAVDVFAKRNGLYIANPEGIVKVSSKVLAGKEITLSIERGHGTEEGTCLPEGIRLLPYPPAAPVDVLIAADSVCEAALLLKPREYSIGVGCKRGKSAEEIERFITEKISGLGILPTQIFALASISQKSGEAGLLTWCRKEGIPFLTYTAEELQAVEGDFAESSFVKAQVGVGNVCERAALRACEEGGRLIAAKYAENGMTIALAKREWKVCFDGE